jgi:hypothetical protein
MNAIGREQQNWKKSKSVMVMIMKPQQLFVAPGIGAPGTKKTELPLTRLMVSPRTTD